MTRRKIWLKTQFPKRAILILFRIQFEKNAESLRDNFGGKFHTSKIELSLEHRWLLYLLYRMGFCGRRKANGAKVMDSSGTLQL